MEQGHLLALPLGGGPDSLPHLRHGENLLGKGIEALLGQGPDLRGHALYGGPSGNEPVGAFLALTLFIILPALFQPFDPVLVLLQFSFILGVFPPKLV